MRRVHALDFLERPWDRMLCGLARGCDDRLAWSEFTNQLTCKRCIASLRRLGRVRPSTAEVRHA